jgi:hypothetical protein
MFSGEDKHKEAGLRIIMRKLLISIFLLSIFLVPAKADSLNLVGSWPFGPSWTVCYSPGYVYMGSGCGVMIIDDTTNTVVNDTIRTNTLVASIAVSGNYLYVGSFDPVAGTAVFTIYDVSNPSSPVKHGTYTVPVPTASAGLFISGNYMYLSCYTNGLYIVDISNPDAPVLAQVYTGPGTHCWNTFVSGSTAYVAFENTLEILDISSLPAAPAPIGSYSSPLGAFPIDVYVSGTTAYVAGYYNVEIVDVSNPAAPAMLGEDDADFYFSGVYSVRLIASGTNVFVSTAFPFNSSGPFIILDASNPAAPVKASVNNPPMNAYQSVVNGNNVYVADGPAGVYVMDWTNPAAAVFVKKLPSYNFDTAMDIKVSGNRAYVAYGSAGFFVFDITNPTLPEMLGMTTTAGYAYSVSLQGGYAFVGDGTNGYDVIDISNPALPQVTGNYPTLSNVSGVYADSGNYVYGAENGGSLSVLNFSAPSTLALSGFCAAPYPLSVITNGNTAYMAVSSTGFSTFDITNRSAPSLLGTLTLPDIACNADLDTVNNVAYVLFNSALTSATTTGNFGVEAVSVANPAAPAMLGTQAYYTQSGGKGVSYRNNFVYISLGIDMGAGLYGGIEVADTSNTPAGGNMVFDTSYEQFMDSVYGITCDTSYVYAADGQYGFGILSHTIDTPTFTSTVTPTITQTVTDTPADTATFTSTPQPPTGTDTQVVSPTMTYTDTPAYTATETATTAPSSTSTRTATATPTYTLTTCVACAPTATPTPTIAPPSSIFTIDNDFVFPNPGYGYPSTIRYTLSQDADTLDIRIYTSGLRLIHEVLYATGSPMVAAGTRDYTWLDSIKDSNGMYYYLITGTKGGKTVRKIGHIEIIK